MLIPFCFIKKKHSLIFKSNKYHAISATCSLYCLCSWIW